MDALERWLRGGLERNGLGLEEGELDLLRLIDGAYAPAIAALEALDLAALPPEPVLDPSRPPAPAPAPAEPGSGA